MKKQLLVSTVITGFLVLGIAANLTERTEHFWVTKSVTDSYQIVLNQNNYATVSEVGTFDNNSSATNSATRQTNLGNDITFHFSSGRGITNNNILDKFCQMPGFQYGWLTNVNPLTGITKIKLSVQQPSAVFRFDFSEDHLLDDYYYSVPQPSYISYRTEEYTGSSSYEFDFTGEHNFFRLQNLSGTLSLTSLTVTYSCMPPIETHRGELRKGTTPLTISPLTVSNGGEITVDYKYVNPIADSSNGVSLFLGSDSTNCYGAYKIFHDRLESSYSGVTFSKLDDGYNRIVFKVEDLNQVRSDCVAPTTINQILFRWFEAGQGVYFDVQVKAGQTKKTEFTMRDSEFVIANFTDIHVTDASMLGENGTTGKTIRYGIQNSNPDLIVFSGDLAGKAADMYDICNFMDEFKIPYFFILGNHDRDGSLSFNSISQAVNQSKYGYIEMGPTGLGSEGNYTVKINNSNGELVHGLVMMDTGNKYTVTDDSLVEYVTNPISGVRYGTFNGRKTYCDPGWNGLRGKQIDWYKDFVQDLGVETTLFCHIPFLEYCKAFEQYQDAVNKNNQAAINACAPIGQCNMGEPICGSIENLGMFDAILEKGSTKNVICGHDHLNDFSLLYQGVRLTYSVKAGEGSYWQNDGNRCGYTALTINNQGKTSLEQIYYNPLTH